VPGPGSQYEGDPVAQGLQLADVVALGALGVDVGVVKAGAQVVVAQVGSASRGQTMTRIDKAVDAKSCQCEAGDAAVHSFFDHAAHLILRYPENCSVCLTTGQQTDQHRIWS
jgi:hypothetical protein